MNLNSFPRLQKYLLGGSRRRGQSAWTNLWRTHFASWMIVVLLLAGIVSAIVGMLGNPQAAAGFWGLVLRPLPHVSTACIWTMVAFDNNERSQTNRLQMFDIMLMLVIAAIGYTIVYGFFWLFAHDLASAPQLSSNTSGLLLWWTGGVFAGVIGRVVRSFVPDTSVPSGRAGNE